MVGKLLIVHPVKETRFFGFLQILFYGCVIVVFGRDVAAAQEDHVENGDSQIFVNALGVTGAIV